MMPKRKDMLFFKRDRGEDTYSVFHAKKTVKTAV